VLEHALRLRRAGADDVARVTARFLAFFVGDGERHFAREEEILLPLVPDGHARARLLADHEEIRRQARWLGERPSAARAEHVGDLLTAHARFEERELFPMLEARLSAAELADVGRRLEAPD
jgi:hypothetical protein